MCRKRPGELYTAGAPHQLQAHQALPRETVGRTRQPTETMYKSPTGHEDAADENAGALTWVTVKTPRTQLLRQDGRKDGTDTLGLLCLNSMVKRLAKHT